MEIEGIKVDIRQTDEIAMREFSHQPKMILWRIPSDLLKTN